MRFKSLLRAKGRLFAVVAAVLSLVVLSPGRGVADKSYYHPQIEILFRLMPDGSVEVDEVRTFRFQGSFSYAFLRREVQGKYGLYGIEYFGAWDADTKEKMRFEKSSGAGVESIKWFYSAANTTRRFLIRYRITGAIQRYGDVAQFYWKAVEEKHARLDNVSLTIVPPRTSPDLFKVFVHGEARPGKIEFSDDFGKATVIQSDVPRSSFVELRVLLDPDLFPGAGMRSGQNYESLLADENKIARTTILAARKEIGVIAASIVLFLALIPTYLRFFFKYGKEPDIDYNAEYEREPPRDLPPAYLPAILSQSSVQIDEMAKAFSASLLECARLGYLQIHEEAGKGIFKKTDFIYKATEKGKQLLSGNPVELMRGERELDWFEKDVMEVVFKKAGDGSTTTGKEVEKWGREMIGRKSKFLLFIKPRAKRLRRDFESKYFKLDDQKSERAKGTFAGIAALVGAIIILMFVFMLRNPAVIILGIATVIAGGAASVPLARRTPEAALEYNRWMAFRKFMSDFSAMKEVGATLLQIWERYLVYATALGVAEKLFSNLKLIAREYQHAVPAAVWYHPTSTEAAAQGLGGGFTSLDSLSQSFSNFQNLSSALSTSTSSGGGFSGGGGGGGGGGSSGAG